MKIFQKSWPNRDLRAMVANNVAQMLEQHTGIIPNEIIYLHKSNVFCNYVIIKPGYCSFFFNYWFVDILFCLVGERLSNEFYNLFRATHGKISRRCL